MPDDPNIASPDRLARWIALGAFILFAIALYFRDGRSIQPFGGAAAAAASADTVTAR